jgi:hypothetical protein
VLWVACPIAAAGGLALLGWGAFRLKDLQPAEDRRVLAEAAEAEARVRPQSIEEKAIQQDEVEEEVLPSDTESKDPDRIPEGTFHAPPTPAIQEPALPPRAEPSFSERRERVRIAERALADRIAAAAPSGWEAFAEIAIDHPSQPEGTRPLLLDLLIRPPRDSGASDVVVTVSSASHPSKARQLADRAAADAYRYQAVTGVAAVPWLVIAVDREMTLGGRTYTREALAASMRRWLPGGTVNVVPAEAVGEWTPSVPGGLRNFE